MYIYYRDKLFYILEFLYYAYVPMYSIKKILKWVNVVVQVQS